MGWPHCRCKKASRRPANQCTSLELLAPTGRDEGLHLHLASGGVPRNDNQSWFDQHHRQLQYRDGLGLGLAVPAVDGQEAAERLTKHRVLTTT
jgi:K+-sensing histidine kinase KdpD